VLHILGKINRQQVIINEQTWV